MEKLSNGFVSGNYAVRFLQDDVVTVCLIAHVKRLDEIYTGVTFCSHKDNFVPAIGRHKAFKRAFSHPLHAKLTINYMNFENFGSWQELNEKPDSLPIKQLQRDYWLRYGEEEKSKGMVE